ncbi:MAG: nucleotidyltransferase domain-containing protein [Patescibacteria group bacterium]
MAQRANISPKIYQQAKKYEEILKKNGIQITSMYVFGSWVKGTAHAWSDIDIAVVSPNFSEDRQAERVRLMYLSEKVDNAIEPHPFRPEDFDDFYYPLANEVKKTGVRLD